VRPSTAALIIVAMLASREVAAQRSRPIQASAVLKTFLREHPQLSALEIAVDTAGTCRTIAASDPTDVGEACDDDEVGPMRTGQADVEAPTKDDPVYDITQALHDASGRLIGAVGMDIPPRGQSRDAVVALAATLLHELESRISSKASLLTPLARRP
jgi:hypothetical protein